MSILKRIETLERRLHPQAQERCDTCRNWIPGLWGNESFDHYRAIAPLCPIGYGMDEGEYKPDPIVCHDCGWQPQIIPVISVAYNNKELDGII